MQTLNPWLHIHAASSQLSGAVLSECAAQPRLEVLYGKCSVTVNLQECTDMKGIITLLFVMLIFKGLSAFHYKPYFQGAHKSTMKCILCSHFHRLNKTQTWFCQFKEKKKKRGLIKILFINFSNITYKFKDTIKALLNRALKSFQHLRTPSFTYSVILLLSENLIKLMKT